MSKVGSPGLMMVLAFEVRLRPARQPAGDNTTLLIRDGENKRGNANYALAGTNPVPVSISFSVSVTFERTSVGLPDIKFSDIRQLIIRWLPGGSELHF